LKKSIPAFDFHLQESLTLKLLFYFIFTLLIISCWSNGLDVSIKIILNLVILVFARMFYRAATHYQGVKKISCLSDGCWKLLDASNESKVYILDESSTLMGPFFFLHFSNKQESINLALAGDSITQEEARKLRLTLKVYKEQLLNAKV